MFPFAGVPFWVPFFEPPPFVFRPQGSRVERAGQRKQRSKQRKQHLACKARQEQQSLAAKVIGGVLVGVIGALSHGASAAKRVCCENDPCFCFLGGGVGGCCVWGLLHFQLNEKLTQFNTERLCCFDSPPLLFLFWGWTWTFLFDSPLSLLFLVLSRGWT